MAKRASASAAAGAAPSLDAKSLPSRPRGKNTYEVVLATAGEVLAEVGFERLTTNLVCERAGLTPPAGTVPSWAAMRAATSGAVNEGPLHPANPPR